MQLPYSSSIQVRVQNAWSVNGLLKVGSSCCRVLIFQVLKLKSVGEGGTAGKDGNAEAGRGGGAVAAAGGGSGSNLSMNQTLEGHEGSVVRTQIHPMNRTANSLG